jgi:ribosomal protein S18 acetylase RimI-like enzyme
MNDDVNIQQGFSEELRASAAGLYDAAFGAKLSIAIPDPVSRVTVLAKGFNPAFSFAAISGDEMVGIAGFKTAQGSLTDGILRVLKEEIGFLGVIRAVLVLALFERKPVAGQLLMDGIGILPRVRGSGIGTKLLHHLIEYAKNEGYQSVRLDVINTNHAARRLYERIGFVPVKTQRFAYLKWLLGFEASTQMEFRLNTDPSQPLAADNAPHHR